MTAYFRHYFYLDEPRRPFNVRIRRDDGVIVYINAWKCFAQHAGRTGRLQHTCGNGRGSQCYLIHCG